MEEPGSDAEGEGGPLKPTWLCSDQLGAHPSSIPWPDGYYQVSAGKHPKARTICEAGPAGLSHALGALPAPNVIFQLGLPAWEMGPPFHGQGSLVCL